MSDLTKPVHRKVEVPGHGRMTVTLVPNNGAPLLRFRPLHSRTSLDLPLAWVYLQAAKKKAEESRAGV